MELLSYHSNLNPLSVLDRPPDETPGNAGLVEFDNSELFNVCEWALFSGVLDWHLRRSWDVHFHLAFDGRFPVGKVSVRDLFV
jgi:hypothetical protein